MAINQHDLPRHIPAAVKRAVRQRCQFACIICGSLVYEYHHFDPPYEAAVEHAADGITLLCGSHHDEATLGLLPSEKIRADNSNPYGVREQGRHLLHLAKPITLIAGTTLFLGEGALVTINGQTLLDISLEDGRVNLNARLSNDQGEIVLEIENNELVVKKEHWDVTFIGTNLKIKRGQRQTILDCVIHPPNGIYFKSMNIAFERGSIVCDSRGIHATRNGNFGPLLLGAVSTTGGCIQITDDTIVIGPNVSFHIYPIDRFQEKARAGEFSQLVQELFAPAFYVRPRINEQTGTECWIVDNRHEEALFVANTIELAIDDAKKRMRETESSHVAIFSQDQPVQYIF